MDASPRSGRSAGIVTVLLTLLGWASVPLFLRYFADYIDGWTANGWRYGLSALIWAPVIVVGMRRGSLPRGLWRAALLPSVLNAAGQVCYAWAPYYIHPGLMSFLLRFQIIVVTLGAWLMFADERRVLRSTAYWIGLVIVFGGSIGTALLGHELPRGATAFGVALGIASGVLYGSYGLMVRRNLRGIHPIVSFAAISQVTALLLLPPMLLLGARGGAVVFSMTSGQFLMLLASAVVGIALGHVFYYASIDRLGVAVTSGVILLMPFVTAVASFFIFNEQLTVAQWISGVAAMLGALLILAAQQRLAPAGAMVPTAPREAIPPSLAGAAPRPALTDK